MCVVLLLFSFLLRGRLDISAVCAYSMKNIQEVFSKGSYKGPVTVEHSPVKWMVYRGEVPVPRPGAVNMNLLALTKEQPLDYLFLVANH